MEPQNKLILAPDAQEWDILPGPEDLRKIILDPDEEILIYDKHDGNILMVANAIVKGDFILTTEGNYYEVIDNIEIL